jgi:hypothetical protein
MKIAAQLFAPYGRYLASVRPSQVDLVMSSHGGGHRASLSRADDLPSKLTSSCRVSDASLKVINHLPYYALGVKDPF